MKKGTTSRSSGKRNGNGNDKAVFNRVSPLPILSSPHPFQTKKIASASAHIAEGFNVNLSLLRTPKSEPRNSPAINNPTPKVCSTVSDLRDVASNRLESMKREMDHTYAALSKELEASSSRLAKRLKLQTQSSTQRAEEADREYKKLCGRLSEDFEEIQATFAELIAEAQASGSRICKTSFPEILNSAEKTLESLRSRYAH